MFLKRRRRHELAIQSVRSARIKPFGGTLAPLMEGPSPGLSGTPAKRQGSVRDWIKGQLHLEKNSTSEQGQKQTELRLLLGVLGAPLAPSTARDQISPMPARCGILETSSANYILRQYLAATGVNKLQKSVQNMYAMGRVEMSASEFETVAKIAHPRNGTKPTKAGCFVLWQMAPDMWNLELALAGCKIRAGSNGKLVWRQTPWSGAHAAKGPIRPLRRFLQGLDPRTTANIFASAQCDGEKKIGEHDCFVLKVVVDPQTLAARSEGPAEIIRHVLFGYFSQRTGLLVRIEDSHLTKVQAAGRDAVYWETTIESTLEDYKFVDGLNIAHAGVTIGTLFRFGEAAMSHTMTRMEEAWYIEEVAYNVPGLSVDGFIPPSGILQRQRGAQGENFEFRSRKGKSNLKSSRCTDTDTDESSETLDNIKWNVEI